MLFTEANMDVVNDFYGNRSTFEYEFEYEYEYVAVFMDIFRLHMDLLTGRCTGVLIGLSGARHWLPRDILAMLVKLEGFVVPQLRLCVSVFVNSCHTKHRIK